MKEERLVAEERAEPKPEEKPHQAENQPPPSII